MWHRLKWTKVESDLYWRPTFFFTLFNLYLPMGAQCCYFTWLRRLCNMLFKLREGFHSPMSSLWEDIITLPKSFKSSHHLTRITAVMAVSENGHSSSSSSERKKKKRYSPVKSQKKNNKTSTTVAQIVQQRWVFLRLLRKMPAFAVSVSRKYTKPRNTPLIFYNSTSRFSNSVGRTKEISITK